MAVVYRCPKCGGVVQVTILLTYPPQTKYYCPKCGWTKIEREELLEITLKEDD